MATRNTSLKQARTITTTRESVYTTEVNGKPTEARVTEQQIQEGGYERNLTTITIGKTKTERYDINRREINDRIEETATKEEDRLDQYGDLPF